MNFTKEKFYKLTLLENENSRSTAADDGMMQLYLMKSCFMIIDECNCVKSVFLLLGKVVR